jgi:predicted  nucleic acid-binding Zn-ribbon protein
MQGEIQSVQKELEEEMKRKSGLKGENEELEHRLGELKEMFQKTSESVEKTLGKSEFDMSGLEEQIRSKIEVETTKMVVTHLFAFSFRMTKRKK